MAGLFITFEGIDGSGKSTQLQLLVDDLARQGHDVLMTRNPGGNAFGQALREILLHTAEPLAPEAELFLFMADRAQHMADTILPALAGGRIVLCDRHVDSTVAYQGYGRGLDLDLIHRLNRAATRGRLPDLTLLYDGPPESLFQRVANRSQATPKRKDRMEAETLAFYQKVREGYQAIQAADPQRVVLLDALQPIEMLREETVRIITNRLLMAG
jgi:dTMP kinase